jgi:hypothetical protein
MSPLFVVALYMTVTKQQDVVQKPGFALQLASLSSLWTPPAKATLLAQALPPSVPIRQGGQVTVNGRSLAVPWSQRQQEIGISDAGLMQALGVDLLDTNDAAKQPVAWFSDPVTTPLVSSTWIAGQYRYLDISQLAEHFGWQIQVNGTSLQVSTPSARVTTVRQGRQSWGDRIVVDLDQPAPWHLTEQPGGAAIVIDAKADPALIRAFNPGPGNQLNALKLEAKGDRTILQLGYADGIRPRVWTLTNPNRLLIDVRPDSIVERNILWAPGIRWQQQLVNLGSDRFPVVSLTIDPHQPGVKLKPIWGNAASTVGTTPLSTVAQRSQVVAAINAGFFNRNTQLPLGAIRSDNKWISGPILNRGAIAWNDAGDITVGHLKLQETLKTSTGRQFVLQSLNSGFVGAGIARYTPDWGSSYTPIIDHEVIATVRNHQIVAQQRTTSAGRPSIPIPRDGYLLVVRAYSDGVNALSVGTTVSVEAATQPTEFNHYAQIMGAGPLLLQNQQIVLNPQSEQFSTAFIQQAASRSVIATTAEGNLMLVAIHNRINGPGPTLAETARLMQQMGAVNALNLDGGSSTALYLGGQLLDRAPSTAARIHNGIGVFVTPNHVAP